MPCDYRKYPKDWKLISRSVIAAAGNRCELCCAPNGEMVHREKAGRYPWYIFFGVPEKAVKIVLTVHHINHDTTDNRPHNLIALCQKCHLRLDRPYHVKNRKCKNT